MFGPVFGVEKNLKIEYRKLFGIEIIRIPNMNTTVRSFYSNSIRIQNYSSHPGPKKNWGGREPFFIFEVHSTCADRNRSPIARTRVDESARS